MSVIKRVALLSLHTSPMEQPGSGDAGGMNVYIRGLASALAETGIEVEIFTRSTAAGQPAVEHPDPGVLRPQRAGRTARKLPKEELPGPAAQHGRRNRTRPRRSSPTAATTSSTPTTGSPASPASSSPACGTSRSCTPCTPWPKSRTSSCNSGEQPEPRRREDGEHRIVDGATRLIANTTAEAAELVSHYGADFDHIDVAPPGVNLSVFTPASRTRSRTEHGIAPGTFHLLFAGRIQRLKGPQILLKAAALLRQRRPDIDLKLTILGALSGARTST